MRKLETNTRRYFVNLLSDYILSKFEKSDNTIIQVTDFESFIVVNGKSTSSTVLDMVLVKTEFIESNKELFKKLDKEDLNIIDIIKYDLKISDIDKGSITTNKSLYVDQHDPISEINISSEFPYGHSLGCGRAMYYYSHYIFNHMYSLLGVNELEFSYSIELDKNEDYKIKVVSESNYSNYQIVNLVLDVFDMDLTEFKKRLLEYNFLEDILNPSIEKPYLIQDRLNDVIIF